MILILYWFCLSPYTANLSFYKMYVCSAGNSEVCHFINLYIYQPNFSSKWQFTIFSFCKFFFHQFAVPSVCNCELTEWSICKMASWWNNMLTKWHVYETKSQRKPASLKQHLDKMAKWQFFDEATSWWNSQLIKWQLDETSSW